MRNLYYTYEIISRLFDKTVVKVDPEGVEVDLNEGNDEIGYVEPKEVPEKK